MAITTKDYKDLQEAFIKVNEDAQRLASEIFLARQHGEGLNPHNFTDEELDHTISILKQEKRRRELAQKKAKLDKLLKCLADMIEIEDFRDCSYFEATAQQIRKMYPEFYGEG